MNDSENGFENNFELITVFSDCNSAEQKEYLAKLMANMIVVDEDINPNEVAIYDVIREYCGLEQMFDRTIEPKQQD